MNFLQRSQGEVAIFALALLVRLALFGALLSSSTFAAATIRPISYAERAAVQMAANYLSSGPQAVYDRLSTSSPLRKLSKSDAFQEIEGRFGPPAGATWELQTVVPALQDHTAVFNISYPSGSDETVVVNLDAENGDFKVHDVRILAEPSASEPLLAPLEANAATPANSGIREGSKTADGITVRNALPRAISARS